MNGELRRWQTAGAGAAWDPRTRRPSGRAGSGRRRVPVLELLESRRLLSIGGGDPQGIATGAGPDTNIWFTSSSNSIGMINPADTTAGVNQTAIPTENAGQGPIAAGQYDILYASDIDKGQIYKVDTSTGALLQTIPVSDGLDSLIFDNNDIIYSAWSTGGAGEVRRVDPTVGISSDTFLATIGNGGHDLALVPGGNFVLATSADTGRIYEVNLNDPGQTPTTFGSGQYTDGIAYDSASRLFAVSNRDAVVELDPQTFNVIASSGPLQGLDGMTFDPVTGNLFVSSWAVNSASGRDGFYEVSLQPGSSFLQATLITNSSFPSTFVPDGIESDGQGNLYMASTDDYKIYRYDMSTGSLAALSSTLSGLDDILPLSGVGAHSAPDYWFFEETADKFGFIDPTTGEITELPPLSTADPQVNGITAGPDGTIWFTEFNANQIGMIDTDTDAITTFPLQTPGAEPYGIVEGPDGNIWFTEARADQIGMINPTTQVIQEFPIDTSGNDEPQGITVGPDKNLWFTLTGTDKIGAMSPTTDKMVGEYAVPTADAGLNEIVSDPADGDLWFTETAADQVGTVNSTTGVVSEFAVPTAASAPGAITVDKQGNVWFAESNATKIAEVSPQSPIHIVEIMSFNQAETYTTAVSASIPFNPAGQTVSLNATVTSYAGTVSEGTATFTVMDGATVIGSSVTVNVVDGTASAQYPLPPGTPWGTYVIDVRYNETADFGYSFDLGHSLTVTELPAAMLSVHTEPPAVATAGQEFATSTQPVVVYEEDQYGDVESGDNITVVTAALAGAAGQLQGTITATVTGGVATFTNLWDTTAGTVTLRFTDVGLTSPPPRTITIVPGPATHLVITTPPPSTLTTGQTFTVGVTAEDQFNNVASSFDGIVTISLAGVSGFPTSVQAKDGVATFAGLSIDTPMQGGWIQASAPGLTPPPPARIPPVSPQIELPPTITGEKPVFVPKTNKKGKPIGKAVLQGFTLDFSTDMSSQAAGSPANYHIVAATGRLTKKKTPIVTPVKVTAANYGAATRSVTLTLKGNQTFAKGGEITVDYSAVVSAAGVALDRTDATFTIEPKAKGITQG